MKKGGGSESTIIIGPSKSVLVYALHNLENVLGLTRFRLFVPKLLLYYVFLLNNNLKLSRKYKKISTLFKELCFSWFVFWFSLKKNISNIKVNFAILMFLHLLVGNSFNSANAHSLRHSVNVKMQKRIKQKVGKFFTLTIWLQLKCFYHHSHHHHHQ